MEVNNSSLIVDERAPAAKGIGSLHFNALANNHKPRLLKKKKMDLKDDQVLLKNQNGKPITIVPKTSVINTNNGTLPMDNGSDISAEEQPIQPTIGDPNVVGLPIAPEDDVNPTNHQFTNPSMGNNQKSKCDTICDLRNVESTLPAPVYPSTSSSTSTSTNPNATHPTQNSFSNRVFNRYQNSIKSWKSEEGRGTSSTTNSYMGRPFSDSSSQMSRPFYDIMSIRSLTSIGMGSTDGKKMIIRKVPQSPSELFNIVSPPTPPEEYLYEADSYDDRSEDGDNTFRKPRRHHWSNKLQFVLACVGYSVGLGSVWRFPYLCYKSGGGVFLIPYFIIMVICGIPLLYMELAIGQFTGRGPIGALGQLCPIFKGAGLASVVISFLMSTYYSVIIAYGIYYFFTSFKPTQPWEECSNRWNTPDCWMPAKLQQNLTRPVNSRTPVEEFYDRKVLQISKGIEFPGMLRWELVACLLCAWFLVYFAIWKSIKSSAKVRYLTATFPFILIIVFLAKSLTLEGANKGMEYFFKPKWELLGEAQVWVNAVAQTFNSMGIAFGSMISFASYNKFNNNILHDTLAVSFVNAITSLLVGIYAFATIGNIASEQNTSIEDVIADGPGLIFYVYPQAMAKMPAARLWASFFFFMLLCLALNSQFAIVEVVVTALQDGFPTMVKRRLLCHEMLVLIVCVVSFLCGLPNLTEGGIYFFQLIDHYAASISIMYLAFFEVIAIAWFYGVNRLSRNVESMTGKAPSLYFKFCWTIAAPLLILAVWIFCLIDYEPPTYNNGQYHYPLWAVILGWFISSLSILCIPIYALYVFIRRPGKTCLDKLRSALQPNLYECDKCGEHLCEHSEQEEQEVQPMLVLRTPDILKTRPNGIIHFETPNSSSITNTPNTNSPIAYSPIVGRTIRNMPGAGRPIYGTSATNSPVIGRSISQNALSRTDREPISSIAASPTDGSVPSGSNSETK